MDLNTFTLSCDHSCCNIQVIKVLSGSICVYLGVCHTPCELCSLVIIQVTKVLYGRFNCVKCPGPNLARTVWPSLSLFPSIRVYYLRVCDMPVEHIQFGVAHRVQQLRWNWFIFFKTKTKTKII